MHAVAENSIRKTLDVLAELAARAVGGKMAMIEFFDGGVLPSGSFGVAGPPYARPIAQLELATKDGRHVGVLSVYDQGARNASNRERTELEPIANAIMAIYSEHDTFKLACTSCVEYCTSGIVITAGSDGLAPPIFVNEALSVVTGFSREELLSGALRCLVGERTDSERFLSLGDRLCSTPLLYEDHTLYKKNGTPFAAEVRAEHIRDSSGNVIQNYIIRDMTSFRDTQQSFDLLTRAVDEASDFFILSSAGTESDTAPSIEYVNSSLCGYLDRSKDELHGESVMSIFSQKNDRETFNLLRQNFRTSTAFEHEMLLERKDGTAFWAEVVAHTIEDENGDKHWLAVGRDISVRRKGQEQIAALVAALDDIEESVIVYEHSEASGLSMTYENNASYEAGDYLLPALLEQSSQHAKRTWSALQEGQRISRWQKHRNSRGEMVWYAFHARYNFDRDGQIASILTRQKRLNVTSLDSMGQLAIDIDERFLAHLEVWSSVNPVPIVNHDQQYIEIPFPNDRHRVVHISWDRALSDTEFVGLASVTSARLFLTEDLCGTYFGGQAVPHGV